MSVIWEPLPKRTKRSRNEKHEIIQNVEKKETIINQQEQTMLNVETRILRKQALATLESGDGCAGEFYECKFSFSFKMILYTNLK